MSCQCVLGGFLAPSCLGNSHSLLWPSPLLCISSVILAIIFFLCKKFSESAFTDTRRPFERHRRGYIQTHVRSGSNAGIRKKVLRIPPQERDIAIIVSTEHPHAAAHLPVVPYPTKEQPTNYPIAGQSTACHRLQKHTIDMNPALVNEASMASKKHGTIHWHLSKERTQ